jgi:uncharacterized PurR-regulated membrane protein YhhQ (DUF165 family)
MRKELKSLFNNKSGLLVILTMVMALVIAYLNIITIKSLVINGTFEISYGTLLISFIPMLVGDVLTECYGWKKSFIISSLAYIVSFFFVLVLWGTTLLPGIVFGGFATDAYNTIFAQQPLLLIASAIAYYAGIFFNCYIMGAMQKRAQEKGTDGTFAFFARCMVSTIIGQFLDNALFFMIGYMPNMLDPEQQEWAINYVWQQVVAAFVLEGIYELILFPVTKYCVKKVNDLPEIEICEV